MPLFCYEASPSIFQADRFLLPAPELCLPGLQVLDLNALLTFHLTQELLLLPGFFQDPLLGSELLLLQLLFQGIGSKGKGEKCISVKYMKAVPVRPLQTQISKA